MSRRTFLLQVRARTLGMVALALASALTLRCGGDAESGTPEGAGAAGTGGGGRTDGAGGAEAGGSAGSGGSADAATDPTIIPVGDGDDNWQYPEENMVDGGGTCAPHADPAQVSACCNDSPCTGRCVLDAQDQVQCTCFGIPGGCTEGFVCCTYGNGCVEPQFCGLSH